MADDTSAVERTGDDYRSLADKLRRFSETLTPAEASALVVLMDHAMQHASEVSGYEFVAPADEVSGFAFSGSSAGFGGLSSGVDVGLAGVGQFGQISGGYLASLGRASGPSGRAY